MTSVPCNRVTIETSRIELSGLENVNVTDPARGLILALHGGGYCSDYWTCPVRKTSLFTLAANLGYHVLALDRPGYGMSYDFDCAQLGLDNQVEFLFDATQKWLSDHDFTGSVSVIGHSLGGIIALLMGAHARATSLSGIDVLGVPFRFSSSPAAQIVTSLTGNGSHIPFIDTGLRKSLMFGPEGSYETASDKHDITAIRPMPKQEHQEAIAMPAMWSSVLPKIRTPIQFACAEFEVMQTADSAVLEEVQALLTGSHHKVVRLQRYSGHNASAHKIAPAYHLRAIAFFEECVAMNPVAPNCST